MCIVLYIIIQCVCEFLAKTFNTTMRFRQVNKKVLFRYTINLLGFILYFYLLYDEIKFFLSKPTHTSKTMINLQPNHFPDILICPFPAYDLHNLARYGYMTSRMFLRGRIRGTKLLGWTGNSSLTVEEIVNDVSTLKTLDDCPFVLAMFEHFHEELEVSLTMLDKFHGRCCKPTIPTTSQNNSVDRLLIRMDRNNIRVDSKIEGFETFISSQRTSHISKMDTFNTNGISLKMYAEKDVVNRYKIKVLESVQLEDDPKAPCKNYNRVSDYAQVKGSLQIHEGTSFTKSPLIMLL